jgi:autotransporter-associated beta strand protein
MRNTPTSLSATRISAHCAAPIDTHPATRRASRIKGLAAIAATAMSLGTVGTASAGTDYWTNNGSNNLSNSSTLWVTAATSGSATSPVSGDSWIFANTNASTLTNNFTNGFVVNGLTFASGTGNDTIVGNAFTLAGGLTNNSTVGSMTISNNITLTNTWNLYMASSSGNLTFAGNLSGNGTFTQTGGGGGAETVNFNGDNSGFTGSFTQDNSGNNRTAFGTANSGSANAAWTFNRAVAGGIALNFGTGTLSFGSLSGSGTFRNNNGNTTTLSVGGLNTNSTFSGQLGNGNIALIKVGTGTFTLNTGSGPNQGATVQAGTLLAGNVGAFGGTALLTVAGTGTANLGGLTMSNTLSMTGGTLTNGTLSNSTGNFNLGGGTVAAVLKGAAGVNQTNNNTTLTASNSYTGTTTIGGGTLTLGATNAISTSTNVTITNAGTLAIGNFNNSVGAVVLGSGTITGGTGTLSASSITTTNGTISAILGGSGTLTQAGTGTTTLSGSNAFTGGVVVNAGAIALANNNGLGAGTVTINNGGKLFLSVNNLTVTNNLAVSGNSTLSLVNSGAGAYNGNISGSGTLVYISDLYAANLTLGGSNSAFSGTFQQTKGNNGTRVIFSSANAGSANATWAFNDDASSQDRVYLQFGTGTISYGALSGVQSITANNGSGGASTIRVGDLNSNTTYSAGFKEANGNTIALRKVGNATQTLNGGSTHSGGTTVQAGTLTAGNATAFGSGTLTVSGGTANLGGLTMTNALILTSGSVTSGTLSNATGNFSVQDGTVGTTLAGAAGLIKSGSGTVTLSQTNTYSGSTTINGGTLKVSATNGIASSAVTIGSGGTLQFDSASSTLRITGLTMSGNAILALSQAASAVNSTGAMTVSGSGATNTIALSGVWNNTLGNYNLVSFTSLSLSDPSILALSYAGGTATLGNSFTYNNNTYTLNSNATSLYLTVGSVSSTVYWSSAPANNQWNTTDANWSSLPNGGGTAQAFTTSNDVTFLNPATTTPITATSNITAGNITVSNSSGTVALNGAGTITGLSFLKADNGNLTISNALSIAGAVTINGTNNTTLGAVSALSLTMNGAGTLTLAGSNNYSAGTIFNSGTIALGTNNAFAGSSTLSFGGSRFDLAGYNQTLSSLGGSGTVTSSRGSGTLTIANDSGTTVANTLTGGLALANTGAGTTTLSASNSYSGGTAVNAGTVAFGTANSFGTGTITLNGGTILNGANGLNVTNAINVTSASVIKMLAGGNFTLSGNILGNGNISYTDTGSTGWLYLAGTNSGYSGTFTAQKDANGNKVQFLNANAGSSAAAWVFNDNSGNDRLHLNFGNGTISFGSLSGSADIKNLYTTAANTSTIRVGDLNRNDTYSGNIGQDNSGTYKTALLKVGTGTLTLSGYNQMQGGIIVDSGVLNVSAGGAGGGIRTALTINTNATVNLTVGDALGYTPGAAATTITVNGGTLNNAAANNNGYVTSFVLNGGNVTSTGGGRFDIQSGYGVTSLSNSATSLWSAQLFIRNTGNLSISNALGSTVNGIDLQISGPINQQNAGSTLTKTGNGTTLLSGTNTYTGTTTISGGSLIVSGLLGNGSYGGSIANSASLILSNSAAQTLSGAITGTGSFTKAGTGTTTLSASNNYSGSTVVNGGTLRAGANSAFGSSNLTVNAGSVDFGSYNHSLGAVSLNGENAVAGGSGTVTGNSFAMNGVAGTVGVSIAGNGATLNKSGSSTLTLSGANSYTGATTVNGGTLVAGSSTAFGTGDLNVNAGATADIGSNNLTQGAVTVANGASFNGSGVLTGTNFTLNNSGTVAATLAGNANLTKGGSGTLTFTAANSYTGTTAINGGTVNLSGSSATLGAGDVSVASGATLAAGSASGSANTLTGNLTVAGGANLNVGSGTYGGLTVNNLTLGGSSGISTAVTFDAGLGANSVITVNGALTLNEGGVVVNLNNILNGITANTTYTLANYGSLSGSGAWTLASSDISFGINGSLVNNGTSLQLVTVGETVAAAYWDGHLGNAWNAHDSTVGNFTTDGLEGSTNYIGALPSAGTDVTFNNATNVSGNVLGQNFTIKSLTFSGTGNTEIVADGSTLNSLNGITVNSGSGTVSIGANITGAGGVTAGSDLTLSGSNSYTGTTAVSGARLTAGSSSAFGSNATVTIANSGVVSLNGNNATFASLSDDGSGVVNNNGTSNSVLTLKPSGFTSISTTLADGTNGGTLGVNYVADPASFVFLGGNNSYSGGTLITSGNLFTTTVNALGSGSLTAAGGVLDLSGGNLNVGPVALTGGTIQNGTLNASAYNLTSGSLNANLADGTNGASALTKSGSSTISLSGANTYSGGTTVNAGELSLGNSEALGTGSVALNGGALSSASAITIGNNVSLNSTGTIISGNSFTLGGVVSGNGNLIKNGSGVVVLAGTNTYTGNTTINAGTLVVSGLLGNGNYAGTISNNALINFANSANQVVSGNIVNNGSLLVNGTGTLTLAGTNSFSGNAAVDANGNATPVLLQSGTTFVTGTTLVTGALTVGGVQADGGSGANAGLVVSGNGTLTGAGTSYLYIGRGNGTGGVSSGVTLSNNARVSFGNLSMGDNGGSAFNAPASTLTLNDTSSLTITGPSVYLANSAGSSASVTLNGSSTLSINSSASGANDFYLGKGGVASITLNGNSVVRVAEDVLFGFTDGAASGSGTLNINGGKFSMGTTSEKWMVVGRAGSGNQTINIGSGTLSFNSNSKLKSAFTGTSGNYAINQTGGVVAFYSDTAGTVLGGGGQIDMNGWGGTGSTTYNLDGGSLIVPQILATSTNGARVFNFGGGTLTFSGTGGMNLGAGGVANVKAGGAIIDSSNNNVTISTGLSNGTGGTTDGGVTKLGTGGLTLSGTSSYTGNTTVSAGTLVVSGLLGSGNYAGIIINNASVTFNNTAAQILSGDVRGAGSLTKGSSGTLTLAGNKSYTGSTTVSGGTLFVAGTLGDGSYSGAIANSGSLVFSNSSSQTLSGVISGSGAFTQAGTGTVTLSGVNTYSGTTTITNGGTLVISGTAGAGTYAISSGSTLNFSSNANTAFNGGDMTFNGSGTLKLEKSLQFGNPGTKTVALSAGGLIWVTGNSAVTGSSGYGGIWNNNLGSLQVDAGSSINFVEAGSSGIVQVDALTGSGTVTAGYAGARTLIVGAANGSGTFSGLLSNNTSGTAGILALTKNGTGTETLTSSNTYTGGTTVNAGTLFIGNSNAIGTGAATINGGTLELNGYSVANSLTLNGGTLANNSVTAVTKTNASLGASGGILDGSGNMTVKFTANSGGLTKNGSGTVTMLTSAQSSGNLAVNSGVFILSNTNLGVFGNASVASGATLKMDSTSQVTNNSGFVWEGQVQGAMTINGTLDLNGAGAVNNTAKFFYGSGTVVNNGSGTSTLTFGLRDTSKTTQINIQDGTNGGITAVDLYQSGYPVNSTLTANFAGSNSYSGLTSLGYYTLLQAGSTTAFSPNSVVKLSYNSQIDLNGYNNTIAGLSGSPTGGNNVMLGGATLTLNTKAASSLNFAGNIVDSGTGVGAVVMAGSGTQTLSGASTYAGSTIVNSGTLIAGNANAFGTGLLKVSGGTADLGGLTLTNGLSLTGGNLTRGILSNTMGSFDLQQGSVSAILAGLAGATKSGNGTVTLTGNNTYSGATTVNGGVLSLGATGSISNTASVTVANGSTLLLGAANQVKSSANLSLGGTLSMGGNESIRVGSQTFSTLTLTGNSVIDFANLSGNSSLTFDQFVMNGNSLSVYNWSGTNQWGTQSTTRVGTSTQLLLTYGTGLSQTDLNKISFYSGGAGSTFLGNGFYSGTEIVPVPEPGVVIAACMLLAWLLVANRGTLLALLRRRA